MMAWLPPPPHGTKDGWHVLIVRDVHEGHDLDEQDQEAVELLHPTGCAVSISTHEGERYKRYECQTQNDLDHAGYYGIFAKDETLRPGVWLIHPWVEEIRGLDWTEYDGGWTVIRLGEIPYEDIDSVEDDRREFEGGMP